MRHSVSLFLTTMNINSPGSVTISGVAILQSPRAIDPQKGPRNVLFDANFCIVEGSQTVTMALLRYFASNEMANDIQKMAEKPFQKAFIVANVHLQTFLLPQIQLISIQIASVTPNSITTFMSDFEVFDYAFVGDICQVSNSFSFITYILPHTTKLIPFDGDVNMQTNPYITITGTVTKFDTDDRSFAMTPTQYVILTHTNSPFPIQAHFADSSSKKRWGAEGPKVAVGSTITLGGLLERVVRDHTIDRALQFAQVEVANIAYLGARSNLAPSPIRMFSFSSS